MKIKKEWNNISIKIGLLFSGVFIGLLLVLGTVFHGVFTDLFVDYIKQDLLVRTNNHSRILGEHFDQSTIAHVVEMEKGVRTDVLITDDNQEILASSVPPDEDMTDHITKANVEKGSVIESDWKNHSYIITISPIKNGGYVYMYYPSSILREIVLGLNVILMAGGAGILLLAFGSIAMMSKRITKPLLMMKDATNKMSLGRYRQAIPVNGEDEIAQLGKSIQSLGEQLQYFEESRNDFLASVSHELRTPLTYIKGYSDILNKGNIKNPDDQREYLGIIHKEATRLSFLINDLFEMSKLQAGFFTLDKEWSSLNPIIEKVVSNLKPAAEKKGLNLVTNLIDIPDIPIDPQRMEQAIYNLVENAVKYTSQGEISISSFSKGNEVFVKVIDNGMGIPKEDLSKIWDRFYRVDQSRTRKSGGTGLGLYVVKKIIDAHGGLVMAESSEDKGSIFTISLNKMFK
ncbi:HAMP domain-containing histidine kinase [Mesobacillus foraminis]|uniref:HAMP domain-containing sensor histidine kinase n=1 Tax=Mesobacillus foraminis TaxID=279826 RepID=UPI001BEC416C|nr:HAMP domain-containing sensor histidine kinase [Mesobacillus foraminis]MBT2758804.1 HAMP domain-containing histidine kinase [Mesobacillus foraminis]